MIEYTLEEFSKVQKSFPRIDYEQKNNCIKGKLDFNVEYQKISKKNGESVWKIVQGLAGTNSLSDCYEIEILLNATQHGWPKVWETGGRIRKLAKEIGKQPIDLHIYPKDDSCCLGIYVNADIVLSDFIVNIVYPYFVWQAYFDKYKAIPPCGEYSHGEKGIEEYLKELEATGRNDLCICNSGKKYKKCCIHNKEAIKNRLAHMKIGL